MKENAAAFVKAFGGPVGPTIFKRSGTRYSQLPAEAASVPQEGGWSISTDKDGRIWLVMSRTLRVLEKGEWVRVAWPADENASGPSMAVAVGDGSAMYVYPTRSPRTGTITTYPDLKCYLAAFKDGKVELTAAPFSKDQWPVFMDGDNALWVMGTPQVPAATRGARGAPARGATRPAAGAARMIEVRRVGVNGVIETIELENAPALLDAAGIVWLAPVKDVFSLWQKGKIVGKAEVAGAGEMPPMFSDKAGSVWLWTAGGLVHLTADAARPAEYQVTGTFAVQDEAGAPVIQAGGVGVSGKGFFFALTGTARGRQMQVAPVP